MNSNGQNGLLIGRWQTLHEGHDWLIKQVLKKGLKPIIAIRDTKIDEQNPHGIGTRMANLVKRYGDSVDIIAIPDIKGVFYGRDVGYEVTELQPPESIKAVSGSAIREKDKTKKVTG
jgi:nicotinamide mononucleotide adenylyltransferase